ncbi:cellulose-growth-specific protein [Heterobasidion irregulare TC 32-1]|uniref:Cellulose-growth-specific protein n=1 Tax=Heterobasidion irregulare (strain TC 32-1) TaxID=747525 RepID=W4K590_HETIT|nr:cellulose-growth-specific protein [Heterobasidion irregulare TC 32-1]ETW80988.1 cellulose-growth-specific protein [Heterobasidion irregulare TC 32-1]
MRPAAFVAGLLTSVGLVSAQSSAWGQCGGIGWRGQHANHSTDYSQCIPSTASSSSASISTAPTSTSPVASSSSAQPPTTTSSGAAPTGSQIRSDQDPTFHFYLQNDVRCISTEGVPVLGPEASSGYFTIDGTIALNGADGTSLYLNVDESAATSYKALTFDSAAVTTDWGLEGDTIITTSPRQLNFLACATNDATVYDVYLQEGNDTPSGQTCSLTSLHLPCLC